MSPTLKLNNGNEIPIIGLGTYKGESNELRQAIQDAIDIGYRHFDCAWFYGNEKEVGDALKEAFNTGKVKREDVFITSKLWNNFHDRTNVVPKLKETLSFLQLDYIDLYLIHWPMGFKEDGDLLPKSSEDYSDVDYLETWKGMEDCFKQGLAKNIGVSNFNVEQLERLLANCEIKPVVNQIEVNPNMSQCQLRQYCSEKNIVVTAFCPLGRSLPNSTDKGQPASTVHDPKVIEMSKKYNKTPAQIVLQYLVNMGISVIPKSVNKDRIKQNFDVLDFELSKDDIAYLEGCNKNIRVSAMEAYRDHKYYPFEK